MIRRATHTRAAGMRTIAGSAAALVLMLGLGTGVRAEAQSQAPAATAQSARTNLPGGIDQGGDYGSQGDDGGRAGPAGDQGNGSEQTDTTTASASESKGVVLIDTNMDYQNASGAGTGMVLTSTGQVLTNNHVVSGATSITVTVPSTDKTYTATVVGTNATDDVALLQLKNATRLSTVKLDTDTEKTGQEVTAVGNAQGRGVLTAAAGQITALKSSVTTQSDGTSGSETLNGMIEISADVVSGDSGGALLDDQGEVIGVNTAASSGTADTVAYAIPIESALSVVAQIRAGEETGGTSLGYPAFLGVEIASEASSSRGGDGASEGGAGDSPGGTGSAGSSESTEGAEVADVIADTPAASAGLAAGDTITAVGSTKVSSASGLTKSLAKHDPGDTVKVSWTDSDGESHTAQVTLTKGPAA